MNGTRPLRIFIVENHRDTLRYLRMFLETVGHTVESARTMKAALAALPAAHCDLLISDIGLPDGDGWELLRQLTPPPSYAVAMSGLGSPEVEGKSKAAGYRHHLVKPFGTSDLEPIISEVLHELSV